LISTPPEPVYLNMDVLRVAQALHNIIGNASKHGHIHVRVQRDGAQAVFIVSYKGFDSGELEPDVGLGLHLARYLVEEHNGTLTIGSSGPGNGSVITVRLPCELPVESPIERPLERPGAEPAGDRFPV
jgi:signal transduction histidine kinase